MLLLHGVKAHSRIISFLYLTSLSLSTVPGPILEKFLINNKTDGAVLEWYCKDRRDRNNCYYVTEFLIYEGYIPVLVRMIAIYRNDQAAHTISVIRPPEDDQSNVFNTSLWKVDAGYVEHCEYQNLFTEALFWSGAIPVKSEINYDVLVIGLGGGSFTNYYEYKYPHLNLTVVELNSVMMDIAEKWFGTKQHDRYRIHIQDGVEYIRRASEEGHQFHGVMVDATYSDLERVVVAPVESFLENDVISNLASVVHKKGVLTMNVVFGRGIVRVIELDYIVRKFQRHFKHVEARMLASFNTVLVCRHEPIVTPNTYRLPPHRPLYQHV